MVLLQFILGFSSGHHPWLSILTIDSAKGVSGQPGIILGFFIKLTPKGVVFSFLFFAKGVH